MRTLLYARYSSQLQNARSIDDQVALLRDRATREGWEVAGIYTDHAISGAAGIGEGARPGLSAMLDRVADLYHPEGRIDQVLAESTDRLARHQGDAFAIRERILYAGARLFTLSDGEVTEYTAAFKGLMDAQFRKELGAKIKRGQRGSVSAGRAPAGLAYGYRKANQLDANGNLVRGLRSIDPEEAEVVRRIFAEFAAGRSALDIARRLNRDGIAAPRGKQWSVSTIVGGRTRTGGVLQNQLYAGILVHNRNSKVVDPQTRRTLIKPNPESDWIREGVPHLRIVPEDLWEAVHARRAATEGTSFRHQRRPKRLLSGLVECGICGAGYIVGGQDTWMCGGRRRGNNCTNGRQISNARLEERVIRGLREGLLDPELVSIFVREYHLEVVRETAELGRARARHERRLADATVKVQRLVAAISDGGGEFAEIRAALAAAKAQRDAAAAELAQVDDLPVIALHPGVAETYRREIDLLGQAAPGSEEADAYRRLIDKVVAVPASVGRGVELEVFGKLSSVIAMATGRPANPSPMFVLERVKGTTHKHAWLRAKA